jgi:hypothetical protein
VEINHKVQGHAIFSDEARQGAQSSSLKEALMKSLCAVFLVILSSAAIAHPSLVPHEHPHGASFLLDFDWVIGAMLLAAFAVLVVKKLRRARAK